MFITIYSLSVTYIVIYVMCDPRN